MHLIVNDRAMALPEGISLSALLTHLDRPAQGHALAVNNTVIPRTQWPEHRLHDGDHVLLIQPIAGG